MITKESIAVKDLKFWEGNYRTRRFIDDTTQENILQDFVSNKQYQVYGLAKSIAGSIAIPPWESLIVYKKGKDNIVKEGNRRLAAYKALINPLSVSDKGDREKFNVLHKQVLGQIKNDLFDHKVDCIVTSTEEEASKYIENKHNNSASFIKWGGYEQLYFRKDQGHELKTKDKLRIELDNIIKGLDFPMKQEIFSQGHINTVWRLLQVRAFGVLGVTYDSNEGNIKIKNIKKFEQILRVHFMDLLAGHKFKNMELSRLKGDEVIQYWERASSGEKSREFRKWMSNSYRDVNLPSINKVPVIPNPKSIARRTLIPNDCILKIEKGKVNDIYLELKDNLPLDDSFDSPTNAVGVLFRVFLEISLLKYSSDKGKTFDKQDGISKMIKWVSDDLEKSGIDKKQLKNIREVGAASPKVSFLSIKNFHEYVHSPDIVPSPSGLKSKWNQLEEFFKILWGEVPDKTNKKIH